MVAGSASTATEDRAGVQLALDTLRPLLADGKVSLFLGEGVSSLPASSTSWWEYLNVQLHDPQACTSLILQREAEALSDPTHFYLYNTLRMVSRWPGVITLNLDQLVEKLLWKGDSDFERIRLDQLAELPKGHPWLQEERKLLIKVFGDTGLVTCFQPKLNDLLISPSPEVAAVLHELLNSRSYLFLGMDLEVHASFFTRFVHSAKMPHYMLLRRSPTRLIRSGRLLSLCSELELWEFTMYLSPGTMTQELVPGVVYERCYLATQREEYLQQQLHLETCASEICFHTLQLTNALATMEELEAIARPKLHDIYKQDPIGSYQDQDVDKAFRAMVGRRDNLLQLIDDGKVPVKSLFFYEEFIKEVEAESSLKKRQMAVRKYADSVLRSRSVLRPNSTLEQFVLAGMSEEDMKTLRTETFALMKLKGGEDEAVCYAEPARSGVKKLQTHLIVVNGTEIANKRRVFERSLARAWPHRESLLRLAAKLVEVDRNIDALDEATFRQLESLHSVVAMLDQSIDAKSLVHLGGGSFGDVYKAVWNGRTVALKFLKDAARPDDIAGFESEFQRLRQAEHANIVKVYKLTVESNRLGLIMEFVDGGNVRQLLEEGPLTPETAFRCATHMASAINHLHAHKIVHRDVKTDNILVSSDRSMFKLADFGLARVVERTEQYKTVKGTFRYMAPEILRGRDGLSAKYSLKVDVYSYGLVLLEVVTGNQVFRDMSREQLEIGKREGRLAPTIPATCEDDYGPVLVAVIRFSVAPVERRPDMSDIVQMLHNNQVPVETVPQHGQCSVLCLGTGKGATTLLQGEPSSSFVLMKEGKQILLVDLGLGVTHSYCKCTGKLLMPERIYITHNHADHAAELPVLLAMLQARRSKDSTVPRPTVFAAPEVMHRLKTQRIPEVCHHLTEEDLAKWKVCRVFPQTIPIDDDEEFHLSPICAQHSEVCYGFVLYHGRLPLLGYTGDSGYSEDLYNQVFAAPNVILDARTHSTYEHAGFTDVQKYMKQVNSTGQRIFITGYGVDSEYPEDGLPGAIRLQTGEEYPLQSASVVHVERTSTTAGYVGTVDGISNLG